MKIAVLSGADKNAGDFLIVQRSEELLESIIGTCEFVHFQRNTNLSNRLNELNSCKVIVFAGGPGYVAQMYPERFPLVDNLDAIKPPFFALGMGARTDTSSINGYKFSNKTKELLDRIQTDGFGLGCRDFLSEKLLRCNGYHDVLMTGCPAWYDLKKVDIPCLMQKPALNQVRTIGISDPAIDTNLEAPIALINELKPIFPDADIKIIFHRGWMEDEFSNASLVARQRELVKWARSNKIEIVDIAYSSKGFSVYDDCDLHIGYRVHAHLYNISQRKPTYLIEEDGRGFGANEALGVSRHIQITRSPIRRYIENFLFKNNIKANSCKVHIDSAKAMAKHVRNEIENGYPETEGECKKAHETYKVMMSHIQRLASLV